MFDDDDFDDDDDVVDIDNDVVVFVPFWYKITEGGGTICPPRGASDNRGGTICPPPGASCLSAVK